jgi:hypothetical protein
VPGGNADDSTIWDFADRIASYFCGGAAVSGRLNRPQPHAGADVDVLKLTSSALLSTFIAISGFAEAASRLARLAMLALNTLLLLPSHSGGHRPRCVQLYAAQLSPLFYAAFPHCARELLSVVRRDLYRSLA